MSWRTLLFLPWVLVASPAALAEDISHVARPGDTPLTLAKTYRVSVAAILARNPGLEPCRIKVGDLVLVPKAPDAKALALPDEEALGRRYVVVSGDVPAAIAERFGVTLDALSGANPGLDPKTLAVGRVLTIPNTTACPPPVAVSRSGEPPSAAPLVMDFQ